jgi:ubiquinone/menaquinone biosynthesis C-methylase UbiE
MKRQLANLANKVLEPMGAKVVQFDGWHKPWDKEFAAWIKQAKASGRDPNDIGDEEWSRDPLKQTLEHHYLPLVNPAATVLELGPGTGRLTRHAIGACRRMILVDYSALVCSWLKTYLKGRGEFQVILIEKPQLKGIEDQSIDAVISNGVFEHLDMDEIFYFLREFHRVLKPGGRCSFNFNNVTSDESLALFAKFRAEVGSKCIFKFHHPETIRRLSELSGLDVLSMSAGAGRLTQIDLIRRSHTALA